MILQFKVKNFLSIREEQTLDFTASADKTYEDYAVVKIKGVRISKLGVVYGPNASGKSNILKALAWFIFYLVASRSKKPGTGTGLTPFMMDEDSRNRNSSFELIFYIGDVRYEYSVVLNNQKIYKEELYFYPNNRRALFYERTWNEDKSNSSISFGPLLKLSATQKLFIESNCISNATVLTTYKNANVEKNVELDKVFNYFESEFMPLLSKNDNLGQLANDVVRLDADSKKFICEMFEKADFNISDIYIKEEKGEVSEEAMEKFRKIAKILHISEPQDKSISTEELFFTHKTPFYTGSLSNMVESEGTNRMYGLSALLFTLIKNNRKRLRVYTLHNSKKSSYCFFHRSGSKSLYFSNGVLGCHSTVFSITSHMYSNRLMPFSLHEIAIEYRIAARLAPSCEPKNIEFLLDSDMYLWILSI